MKRLVALLLTGCMTLSLCACSNGGSGNQASTSDTVAEEVVIEGDSNVNPAGEFPIVNEPITLNIMVAQEATVEDMVTNEFTLYLEELTGIHIEWETVPQSSASEKLNVMLSTGSELPDVFMGFDINLSQQNTFGKDQGMFVNLEPYLETYGPNILKSFEDMPTLEAMSKLPTGELYGISGAEETFHVKFQEKLWIHEDYVEALGGELPTTTDEFKEMLIKIRDEDINGNGNTSDEIPLIGATTGWSTDPVPFIMSAFIEYYEMDNVVSAEIPLTVVDGEIKVAAGIDDFKEGLMYMNELVSEGLLDPVSFTQDQNQLKTLTGNEENIVGVVASGAPGGAVNGVENHMKWTAIQPLVGPSGNEYTRYVPLSPTIGRYVITSECENVEAAIRLVDYLMSEEGTLKSNIGTEGVDWYYNEDPEVLGLNGEQAVYIRVTPYGEVQNVNWGKIAPSNMHDSLRNGQAADVSATNTEQMLYDESAEKYESFNDSKFILGVAILDEDMSEFVDITTSLETYLKQVLTEYIVGTRSFDTWDAHVSTLESMGVERLEEILNTTYAAQYGSYGLE
ncbi:MAG: extracellular solute-binding protein [Eubacteriales bacterium]